MAARTTSEAPVLDGRKDRPMGSDNGLDDQVEVRPQQLVGEETRQRDEEGESRQAKRLKSPEKAAASTPPKTNQETDRQDVRDRESPKLQYEA